MLAVSTLLYVGLAEVDAGIVAFALASIVMALGFTFYSGAMEAWVVDALNATGYRGVLDHVFARGQQVTGAAMLVGTIGGGLLGQIDLSLPYIVRSLLLAAVFVVAFFVMHDIGFTPRHVTRQELPTEMSATPVPVSSSAGRSGRFACSCSRRWSRPASSCGPSMPRSHICSIYSTPTRSGSRVRSPRGSPPDDPRQ